MQSVPTSVRKHTMQSQHEAIFDIEPFYSAFFDTHNVVFDR